MPLTSRREDPAEAGLLRALATLWELGADRALEDVLDTAPGAGEERPSRCSLPGYQFLGEDPEQADEALPPAPVAPRAPASVSAPSPASSPARRPDTRAVLAELWCRTLGVPVALDDDSFFALGGESLMAVTLTAQVRSSPAACCP